MTKTSLSCLALAVPMVAMMGACTIVASTDSDAGAGGASAAGGGTGTGGSTGTGGITGTGGATNNDAGATGGAGGSNSDAATTALDDPCTGPETTPNDDRSHATIYPLNVPVHGCVQSDDDFDFYEFTTPTTPAQGGFVKIQIIDVATTATIDAHLFSAHDNGEFGRSYNGTGGGSVFMWFGAQPGATYRVSVGKFYGVTQPSAYLFTAQFTGVPDTYEPNDDSPHAKPITVNTEVNGYFFAGFLDSTASAASAWYDYYSINLAAAHVKIAVQPATDVTAQFALYNSNVSQIADPYDGTAGSTVVYETDLTEAGTYYINVHPFYGIDPRGEGSTFPAYLTNPYKLTVTQ